MDSRATDCGKLIVALIVLFSTNATICALVKTLIYAFLF